MNTDPTDFFLSYVHHKIRSQAPGSTEVHRNCFAWANLWPLKVVPGGDWHLNPFGCVSFQLGTETLRRLGSSFDLTMPTLAVTITLRRYSVTFARFAITHLKHTQSI
jgi:hypothetical protein